MFSNISLLVLKESITGHIFPFFQTTKNPNGGDVPISGKPVLFFVQVGKEMFSWLTNV